VFVEVKTGGAGLTGRERAVKEAVREGEVEWVEMRVGVGERGVA
jgi:predicted Holliday junction resolvase-like endonuclease